VAKFCLGRYWRSASPEQQQTYTKLFHQVWSNNLLSKMGEYRNVQITVGKAQQRDEEIYVSTVVFRPNNPPNNVDWIIHDQAGAMKIIDIIAEGTSMRLTQRQDYASFLQHNNGNIGSLIDALQKQLDQQEAQ
jgi:phospholipid transport system substrate-binding protein